MFTPVETVVGAAFMHIGTTSLLFSTGSVLGCSGILGNLTDEKNLPTFAGVILSALATKFLLPGLAPNFPPVAAPWVSAVSGLLVGAGTKLANGCTSGHMLCGIPRGSLRSFIATLIFFPVAVLTTRVLDTAPSCLNGSCSTLSLPSTSQIQGMALALVLASGGATLVKKLKNPTVARVFSGFVFGCGLVLTGMAGPAKTLGFLAFGDWAKWDPSMALLAIVALSGNAVAWYGKVGKEKLWCEGEKWTVSVRRDVDWRLVLGSALFGVGWGLSGICPGPGAMGLVWNGLEGLKWAVTFQIGRKLMERL
ncbi:hypothetical protein EX30DRAFT_301722 [Ascodesmis nigricans]|uniref:Uncharacterized protein n=1 Tax=Ascodesmis nigricans TaxID=341454 RepID=A0A4S2N872_9PEZI|nr:hypothetical protein EX30DRAFT_301722 [Ascodesmis nigricans]